jgi:plastocyanin
MAFGAIGIATIIGVILFSQISTMGGVSAPVNPHAHHESVVVPEGPEVESAQPSQEIQTIDDGKRFDISGTVTFEGTPPVGKKLNLPSGCATPGQGAVYSNEVIVNNGRLQNVLVRVIKGHEGKISSEASSEEIILDQKGCIYNPRVVAARVGQKVTFINSDPIFHNVRSVTKENQRFNVAMPKKNQRETRVFNKPEIFLQAKCSVHPWMGAYVAIMDHSFYGISNKKGEFTLPQLPRGQYTIEAWHEVFGTQVQEITVGDSMLSGLKFNFKKKDL